MIIFISTQSPNSAAGQFYKKLIDIRKQFSSLRTGSFNTILADGMIYGYEREDEKSKIIVLINNDTKINKVKIPIDVTVISSVLDESTVDVIFSGLMSDSTPESVTISDWEYIPWLECLTLKCNPSDTVFRYLIAPPLTTVVEPEPTYTIAEDASIFGCPWIWSIRIVLNALITPTLLGIRGSELIHRILNYFN